MVSFVIKLCFKLSKCQVASHSITLVDQFSRHKIRIAASETSQPLLLPFSDRTFFHSPTFPPDSLIPPAFPCLVPSVKTRSITNSSRKNLEADLEQV